MARPESPSHRGARSSPRWPRRSIVAVGGGKGGIGKSLITSSLGICLAKRGRRVVLIDASGERVGVLLGDNPDLGLGQARGNRHLFDHVHQLRLFGLRR
ncbi:MAG: P-loop NTPase, partial [Dehalococcoidia bacterium]